MMMMMMSMEKKESKWINMIKAPISANRVECGILDYLVFIIDAQICSNKIKWN